MSEAAALGYVYCVIKSDSNFNTEEVKIGPEVQELLAQTLPSHSFHKELELIANYSDLQEQKTAAAAAASTANAATTSPPNAVSGGTSVLATTSSAVDSKGPIPAPPVPVGRQRSMDEKEYQVLQMMEASGEDKDTCTFYLESMDYNLEAAMDLYKSNLK